MTWFGFNQESFGVNIDHSQDQNQAGTWPSHGWNKMFLELGYLTALTRSTLKKVLPESFKFVIAAGRNQTWTPNKKSAV